MIKTKVIFAAACAFLLALATAPMLRAQATLGKVEGHVTQGGKPLANATVIFTLTGSGRATKMKTDKNGDYFGVGLTVGDYDVEVLSPTGEGMFKKKVQLIINDRGTPQKEDIDVGSGTAPKMTKEQREKIEAENAKITSINTLINQAQAALTAQNWQEAEITLKQLVVAEPWRWEFFQALGNAQSNLQEYEDSAASYQKGVAAAQSIVDGTVGKTPGTPPDPAKAKAGIGQMLGAEGNVLLKLKKTDEAVAAFTKAAELDPNPGTAYFNICATQYNTGNMDAAEAACTKAIAADPNKADAYFIKASALFGKGKMDASQKWTVPDGTTQALNKYLELAPTGAHANDVKQMLEAVGAKIETTYKQKKK
jgi:tetratricopeptide (TPR) repeat protein